MSGEEIPSELDLRRQGWDLAEQDADDGASITIIDAAKMDGVRRLQLMAVTRPDERRMMLVGSANTPEARAHWLADGFGDAVGNGTSLEELDVRARRLHDFACWIPGRRVMATLELELVAREATYNGKSLNLHPREFAILWRLAETPDEPVSRDTLLRDVWRQDVVPESNSIAVHISRLRAKLATAGLAGLVEMGGSSGYRLRCSILNAPSTAWRSQPSRHATQ